MTRLSLFFGVVALWLASAGVAFGQNVQAANVRTLVFVGRHVEGQVTTTLDSRGAALFGLGRTLMLGRAETS